MFEQFKRKSKFFQKGLTGEFIGTEAILAHSAAELLRTRRVATAQNKLRAILRFPDTLPSYEVLVENLFIRYAEFVQRLPATDKGYYAELGGLLEHGIDRACLAALRCRHYFLQDSPEDQVLSEEYALWIYVVMSAALFHRIGYSILKLDVLVTDEHDSEHLAWSPFSGTLQTQGTHYRYVFREGNADALSGYATILLARQLLPEAGFLWISRDQNVLYSWILLLDEQWHQMNALANIIPQAQADSILNYFGERIELNEQPASWLDRSYDRGDAAKESKNDDGAMLKEFFEWIRDGVQRRHISVNKLNAPIHVLDHGLLLAYPLLFTEFLKTHAHFGDRQAMIQRFLRLGIHRVDGGQQGVMHFKMTDEANQTRLIKGLVIENLHLIFPNGLPPHLAAPLRHQVVEVQQEFVTHIPTPGVNLPPLLPERPAPGLPD